ncbi:MAG: PEP-CTERM sorting domain-containing protein [bacterium]|nr:PEP-CTERM sorting domain-containing protein [bacterium]
MGDDIVVQLWVSSLVDGGPVSLGDFDLGIDFDHSVLSFSSYTLGGSLGDLSGGQALDFSLGVVAPGSVRIAEVSLLEADVLSCVFCTGPYLDVIQPSSFLLAQLVFHQNGIVPGDQTSILVGQVFAFGDGFGQALVVDSIGGATITAVPEPGTFLLVALGLVGLSSCRTRGRHQMIRAVLSWGMALLALQAAPAGAQQWCIGADEGCVNPTPFLSQADWRWATELIGTQETTFAECGCAYTAVAMAMQAEVLRRPGGGTNGTSEFGHPANPLGIHDFGERFGVASGYVGVCGANPESLFSTISLWRRFFGNRTAFTPYMLVDRTRMVDAVQRGLPVVLNVVSGSTRHMIVATGWNDVEGEFTILDPWLTESQMSRFIVADYGQLPIGDPNRGLGLFFTGPIVESSLTFKDWSEKESGLSGWAIDVGFVLESVPLDAPLGIVDQLLFLGQSPVELLA